MRLTLIILLLAIYYQSHSQELEREYGKITQDEIELISYEDDKNAGAVILFDKGESFFSDTEKGGYNIMFTRHKRIKIFKKSAFEFAEISIPFYVDGYGKTEVIRSIEATTYNYENGKLISKELNPSTIYEEKYNDSWRNKKFVFPNVQEGSILEFRYVLETPFHFNLPDWTFQDKIPTIYSKYEVRMIPFYEYVFLVQGIFKFDEQISIVAKEKRTWGSVSKSYGKNVGSGIEFQDYIHTYILKNISAFKDESYISSINDYIIKMDFQLSKFHTPHGGTIEIMSTWQKLNKALLKHKRFGKYKKNCARYAKKILRNDLNVSGISEQEKIIRIIEYVKNNFNWNGHNSKYASQSAKEFFNNKSGNTADINLFLLALLDKVEIEAYPVILSTRKHGKIKMNYPFDHFTNCVVALVKTKKPFLANGTDNLLPYNKLPISYLNEKGLIVSKKDKPKWIILENSNSSLKKNLISIKIDTQSLNSNVNISINSTGYQAYSSRSEFKNDTSAIKEFYVKKIGKIDLVKTFGYKETNKTYSIEIGGTYITEKIEENIIINPFLNLAILKNSLTQKKRKYPVDFIYPRNILFEITLEIPVGFMLVSIPKSFKMNNELIEINTNYSSTGKLLEIVGNYKFKKPIYMSNEYSKIKFYIDIIIKKFNEVIVLKKI